MPRHYRFGEWTVLPELNEMRRSGHRQALERKTMDVLVCLLERPQEVVPVEAILDEVWAGQVVEQNSVHQRIHRIRKVTGDDARSPRYIAHVPRRGYRTVAHVAVLAPEEDGATVPSPATGPQVISIPPPSRPPVGMRGSLVSLNRFLLVGTGWRAYPVLFLIGAVPWLIALAGGLWRDRPVPPESPLWQICTPSAELLAATGQGFSSRWNWLIYPLLLPSWLFAQRWLFRLSYGASPDSPLRYDARYRGINANLQAVLGDWRPTAMVIAVNLVLTTVDQADVAMRFVDVASACPGAGADWGYFGHLFPDVSRSASGLLTAWTTLKQMIFVHMALITAVHVYLFNSRYMHSVYLRSDPSRHVNSYILDFDDPDCRFGLRPLSRIFDVQLLFCVVGGSVLLTERYFNTDLNLVDALATAFTCGLGLFPERCDVLGGWSPAEAARLVQDTAQLFVVTSWMLFLCTILYIANVKLLPLRRVGETRGRIAYLREFLPPGSRYDRMLDAGDVAQVDTVVGAFRKQHFWPIGDDRAADALTLCVLIFLLMLVPLVPANAPQSVLFATFAISSYLLARVFLGSQRHLLARVDRSLIAA